MSKRMPLRLADSVEGLNKLAELNKDIKSKSAVMLSKSTLSVLKVAEKQNKLGDEENAYIFYMKYFTLIEIIRKARDYPTVKNRIKEFFGTNKEIHNRMNILEGLKLSLEKRYEEREKSNQKEIKEDQIKTKDIVSVDVSAKNTSKFIFCTSLYKAMTEAKEKILLMDCRPTDDFLESRIRHENLINIPGHIIIPGTSASMLSEKIDPNKQHLWQARGTMDLIVLIDEDSTESQASDKPVWILRNILLKWDPDTIYKNLLLLEGGFASFLVYYPMLTTNPQFKPKPKNDPTYYDLNEIEYPSFYDIKMKSTEDSFPQNIPRFDRSVKPTIGQKPAEQQKPINYVSIVKEQEMIIDQVLQKEQEALKIGDELSNIVNAPIAQNEDEQNEWFTKQTELEYKFIQKENELNDSIMDLNSTMLDFESKVESLQVRLHQPEVAEIMDRIKKKNNKHSEYDRKIKEMARKIEEKRKAHREKQKRFYQSKEAEEELIRPKQPAFDRSAKPSYDHSVNFPPIQRDFEPVFGSYGGIGATGLKNLGNTCYMNSILQCILNLRVFGEYLREGSYSRHLNRKSKTHGRITEELAHLCKELWSGKYKSIAPRDFRNVIGQENKMFASYDQQDSHEFLIILLDFLHLELQFPMDDPISSANATKSELAWREFSKNMESAIQAHFFGQIRSTVKCRTCGYESATYEGFSHLSLELPQDNRQCSLTDCLNLYFNGESIDGWFCPQCKQNRDAIKKLDICRLPPVLVIHLKRFFASLDCTYYKKQNYVHFPINNFDISDYVTNSVKQRRPVSPYNLFAVSNHYGTLNRGHYTAFCKNYKSKVWYKYDDNYVTQISSNDVNSSAGYILFYSYIE